MAIPELIVFWKCTNNATWETLKYSQRLVQFEAAVRHATLVRRHHLSGDGVWMFLGPEYAFARRNHQQPQAAEQVTRLKEQLLLAKMSNMTSADTRLLLIPGTIVVRDTLGGMGRARNTSHAYFDGYPVWNYGKITNLQETNPNDHTTQFIPGVGYGMTTINQTTYGGEICADATHGVLPQQVEVHVIQGQSVHHNDVVNRATRLQVVGDYALPQVWAYNNGAATQVQPVYQTRCQAADLIYFTT